MDPAQWIAAFRTTHEQAKKGSLSEGEQQRYLAMCDELARSLMTAQGLTVPEKVSPRRAFKVAHVFNIELGDLYRTTTRELSCTGFTATVGATNIKEKEVIAFSLTLGRAVEPIKGSAFINTALRQPGNSTKVTCEFLKLTENQLARIESALFDAALSRFG